jgi:iron complex transport system permease protein
MLNKKTYFSSATLLFSIGLVVLVLFDLTLGSVEIGLTDLFQLFTGSDQANEMKLVLENFRIPRVATAVLSGAALSVAGLLMQTLFQNPLAGPYVLGINSGASMMVALSTMLGFSFVGNDVSLVLSALIGALGAGIFILFCSIYVKSRISLLLVGVMFGSFAAAIVNVIQSYSNPDDLKLFMLWSFGSLQNVSLEQLGLFASIVLLGVLLTIFVVKPLDLLVLGERDAAILGVKIRQVRLLIVFITAILTGVVTAFCGPIAFIGLVVPNIVKMIYKTTSHLKLLVGVILFGAFLIVLCDIAMQLLSDFISLPLNSLTALIGAPIVVWIIIRKF